MTRRAVGMILSGVLFLGFVVCLAVMTASAPRLGLGNWVVVTASAGLLLLAGTTILYLAAEAPQPRPAVCPIDRELWQMIDEAADPRPR
jgi:hypothetical protein